MSSEYLVPYWLDDEDYYPLKDPRRKSHVAEIKRRKRVDGIIAACVGDKSYSMILPCNVNV